MRLQSWLLRSGYESRPASSRPRSCRGCRGCCAAATNRDKFPCPDSPVGIGRGCCAAATNRDVVGVAAYVHPCWSWLLRSGYESRPPFALRLPIGLFAVVAAAQRLRIETLFSFQGQTQHACRGCCAAATNRDVLVPFGRSLLSSWLLRSGYESRRCTSSVMIQCPLLVVAAAQRLRIETSRSS